MNKLAFLVVWFGLLIAISIEDVDGRNKKGKDIKTGTIPIGGPENKEKDKKATHIKDQPLKKNAKKEKKNADVEPLQRTTSIDGAKNKEKDKKATHIKDQPVKKNAKKKKKNADAVHLQRTKSIDGAENKENDRKTTHIKDQPVKKNAKKEKKNADVIPLEGGSDIENETKFNMEELHGNLKLYLSKIKTPQKALTLHRNIVDHLIKEMKLRLQGEQKGLRFGNLVLVGSTSEDVQVIAAEDFDVSVEIDIGELLSKESQIPGYDFIESLKCAKTKLCGHDGLKVIPFKVISRLQSIIHENLQYFEKYGDSPDLKYKPGYQGPTVKVEICQNNKCLLRVEFVPLVTVRSSGHKYVAKSYRDEEIERETTWRRSFAKEERELLSRYNRKSTCHLDVLRIMKAIVKTDPALNTTKKNHRLTSYHMKTTLFHLIKRTGGSDWPPNELPIHFLKFLRTLRDFLKQEHMGSYFLEGVNLFKSISHDNIPNILNRIESYLEQPQQLYKILLDEKDKVDSHHDEL